MIHVEDDDLLMQYKKGPLDGVKSSLMDSFTDEMTDRSSVLQSYMFKAYFN